MDEYFICPWCSQHIPTKKDAFGHLMKCPACGKAIEHVDQPDTGYIPHEAECPQCGKLFYLKDMLEYKGRNYCIHCAHIFQLHENAETKHRRAITFNLLALAILAVAGAVAYKVYWQESLPYKITKIDCRLDSDSRLGLIGIDIEEASGGDNDEYILVCSLDSTSEMEKIAKSTIKELALSETRNRHLARWMPEDESAQFFLGKYGRGKLEWIDPHRRIRISGSSFDAVYRRHQWLNQEIRRYDVRIKSIGIRVAVLLDADPKGHIEIDLKEKNLGRFVVNGKIIVKVQLWARAGNDWTAASKVFEEEISD